MPNIVTVIKRLEKLSKNLPLIAGNVVVNETQENFRREGFFSQKTWKKRKNNLDPSRGILTKSGRLRLSIKITKRDANTATVGTDTPYARRHNQGLAGMPKRQFLGDHPLQLKAIRNEIAILFRRAFR